MSRRICHYCGAVNTIDALFCISCGTKLEAGDGIPYADMDSSEQNGLKRPGDSPERNGLRKPGDSPERNGLRKPDDIADQNGLRKPENTANHSSDGGRVEYLGRMEFDITHTIEDYEYTRRSVTDMNRIVDSEEFREMDSDTIFHYLVGQMKIASFKDYLKRYIYERNPQQVPFAKMKEDTYISIIIDSFRKNHTPGSFNEVEIRWKATVRYWLRKESATRDNVFLLGFGLKMSDIDVSDFLTKVLKEQDFRFHDPRETIFWYCYHYGLEYGQAKKYLEYYEGLTPEDLKKRGKNNDTILSLLDKEFDHYDDDLSFDSGWKNAEFTVSDLYQSAEDSVMGSLPIAAVAGRDVESVLTDEEMLLDYLAELKLHQDEKPDVVRKEYRKLYRRAARAAGKVLGYEDEAGGSGKGQARRPASPADIETILCSGIPKTKSGNLVNVSKSILQKQFHKRRMSRQRISRAMKHSHVIERFDFITLLFLVYAAEVEPDWPVERFMRYIDEINAILARCSMMSIYPVNPYESFILMCLLTDEPLATYADIWEMSHI